MLRKMVEVNGGNPGEEESLWWERFVKGLRCQIASVITRRNV